MLGDRTRSFSNHRAQLRQYCLENQSGFRVELLNLGASIRSIRVPGRNGPIEAILSYPDVNQYLSDNCYVGATVGRYANRIENALLKIEERSYPLVGSKSNGGHCLHGGDVGFSRRFWTADANASSKSIQFRLVSEDGDQGFPGTLDACVSYTLLEDWKLLIEFRAVADSETAINLANHAYFNLNEDTASVANHLLMVNARHYTPLRSDLIPDGTIQDVEGTPFDFRQSGSLQSHLDLSSDQLSIAGGFDHNLLVDGKAGEMRKAASLQSPSSGLGLNIFTTQAGLQLYAGQYLESPLSPLGGICLEAQGFPNAPNEPAFPGGVFAAGEVYQQQTIYEFIQES